MINGSIGDKVTGDKDRMRKDGPDVFIYISGRPFPSWLAAVPSYCHWVIDEHTTFGQEKMLLPPLSGTDQIKYYIFQPRNVSG